MSQYLSSTLAKGLQILEYLTRHDSASLQTIATDLDLNKTTAFRLLASLVELNYVKKADKRYMLATKNQLLTQFNRPKLNWIAVPITQQITQKYHVTAYIGILNGPDVVITQVIDDHHSLAEYHKIGLAAPINESALGKCIAAYLPSAKRDYLLTQLTSQPTKYTLHDRIALAQNFQVIRTQGYSLDDEESSFGIRCLAVPIRQNEQVIASLGIAGSIAQLPRHQLKQLANVLTRCSQTIASQLA